jgi:hypothetical protein
MKDGRTADVCPQISESVPEAPQGRYQPIEVPAAPKLDVEALRAEQTQCLARAAAIESLLNPPRVSAVVALVLAAGKPIKGCHVARMLGKAGPYACTQLSIGVDRGQIRRVAVGTYAAPEVRS